MPRLQACLRAQIQGFWSWPSRLVSLPSSIHEQWPLWLCPGQHCQTTAYSEKSRISDAAKTWKVKRRIFLTLSVRIPQSKALESVSNTASTLREAILRQASCTVVLSGIVSALDNLSLFTVLSPVSDLKTHYMRWHFSDINPITCAQSSIHLTAETMVDQSEYSSNQGRFVAKLLLLVKMCIFYVTQNSKSRGML